MTRLIPIETGLTVPEALVLKSLLEARGIFANLDEYHHATVAWYHLFALQGIRLSVPEADIELARALIDDARATTGQRKTGERRKVSGQRTSVRPGDIIVAIATLWIAGLPFPFWERRRTDDKKQ